jgi:hypothetical protein
MNEGIRAEVYGYGTRNMLSFRLGQYTTLFWEDVHAIMVCPAEDRGYETGTSALHQIIKQQLKHFAIDRFILSWFGSVINLS